MENKKYNHLNFANLISKLSKVQVIVIKNQYELKKYLQRNLISNELIIGMGAGSISKWMRELKINIMNSNLNLIKKIW